MADKQFDPFPWSLKEAVENNFFEVSIYRSLFHRDNVLRRSSCLFYKAWNSDPYFTKSETKKKLRYPF